MSDVMKAIREADEAIHEAHMARRSPSCYPEDPDLVAFRAQAGAYEAMRDHIGELHAAIAKVQEQYEREVTNVRPGGMIIRKPTYEDLFDLLPSDWAGETE